MVTDQKNHSSRHSDGGSDELDAADLAGAAGTSGQLLQTDGSAASWVDFSGGHSVSDSGTQVLAEPDDVNFNSNLTVTDDGDGSVTVDASGGGSTESTITVSSSYTTSGETTVFVDTILNQSIDGFEDGDFTANPSWTEYNNGNGSAAVNGNNPFNGSFSLELPSAFGGAEVVYDRGSGHTTDDGATFTTWVNGDALANPNGFVLSNSNDGSFGLNYNDAVEYNVYEGDFVTYDASGNQLDSYNGTIRAGEWLKVEIQLKPSFSEAVCKIYDNSETLVESTTLNTTGASLRYVKCFKTRANFSQNVYFDDVTYESSTNKVTLSSSDVSDGKIVRVVDTSGNAGTSYLNIKTEGSETINGEPDAVINNNYEALTFQSDGSDWYVVSRMSGGGTT